MVSSQPRFSVIIPTLNEEKFLPNLLASLASQSQKDFEVIVVDGSSKDKTVSVATSFKKALPYLEVVVSKKASLPLQRNMGAGLSRGKWLIFIDADSVLSPYFFERIDSFISQQNPELFTTWFRPDSDGNGDAIITLLGVLMVEGSLLFKRPIAPGPLTIVRRDIYEKVGGYDEAYAFGEDVDFGLRTYKAGVMLQILRESLYTVSLRRVRKNGALKMVQQYIAGALPILLFKRSMKFMPGYTMGGHLYSKKGKPIKKSVIARYETKLKRLMKELYAHYR